MTLLDFLGFVRLRREVVCDFASVVLELAVGFVVRLVFGVAGSRLRLV